MSWVNCPKEFSGRMPDVFSGIFSGGIYLGNVGSCLGCTDWRSYSDGEFSWMMSGGIFRGDEFVLLEEYPGISGIGKFFAGGSP